ncbi:hypothetical protein SERLA73DRAFT_69784 [Serpula lacrymans var. lacrymans S7.3]|uniref:Uncharacterized protein n=2 Tax=Serpula lacrymans var. lacrymans TaxID=341189 RepID=F8PL70_SERL3|nr:uncharacterized protein SERLADRAFT_433848 [Serpula lacrymans var. lacrymans S7.9]EGO03978.1 hypothetical protein SERLA73DRAFT_69784 [Serpula lacrymans var. lacrymans S7.3]EGO29898.1 hypothetical protein SERLADRAFT_433848 [Serpula lacrymans var. lacrymans S7.9]
MHQGSSEYSIPPGFPPCRTRNLRKRTLLHVSRTMNADFESTDIIAFSVPNAADFDHNKSGCTLFWTLSWWQQSLQIPPRWLACDLPSAGSGDQRNEAIDFGVSAYESVWPQMYGYRLNSANNNVRTCTTTSTHVVSAIYDSNLSGIMQC